MDEHTTRLTRYGRVSRSVTTARDVCSSCGKPVIRNLKTSRPEIICHDCRRLNPQRAPRQQHYLPVTLTCPACGKTFQPRSKGRGRAPQKYCSKKCGRTSGNGQQATQLICPECGKAFRHRGGAKAQTCSRACGVKLRRRNGTLPPPTWPTCRIHILQCDHCQNPFTARRPDVKYCSRRCCAHARLETCSCQPRQCPCGQPVSPPRRKCDTCIARTKSESRRRDDARHRGVKREPYTLAYIAERDRYRCGLCGKRVAMTKAVPHPKAPTIDHIIPRAAGGDDTRANVQLAHFWCNSKKHTGGTQQLALIG